MARVTIDDATVNVHLSGLDVVWAVHGSLHIPLTHIARARVEDEDGWKHLWRKLCGMSAPGLKMAGTFFANGGLAFLDYSSGRDCLVIETQHEQYGTIIVQPDEDQDSSALAAEINQRIAQQQ